MMAAEAKKVLLVGGTSGIAREIATQVIAAGDEVIIAGRHPSAIHRPPGATTLALDLADEQSISQAAEKVGTVDAIIILAADHANGPITSLDADRIRRALDAKVVGPILVAKHFAPLMPPDGVIILFSGIAATRPNADLVVMATANRAAEGLADALAVELAPIRVLSVSPGIVDSGSWDALGEAAKNRLFAETSQSNPARRVGSPADIAQVVLLALTNPFITGTTLHIDGGGRLS